MIKLNPGTNIRIIRMSGEPNYTDKCGTINHIDDIGQLHGTWGGLAVNLDVDDIEVLIR